jgi:hypothetical protein
MYAKLFKPTVVPVTVQRNTDILTVVEVATDLSQITANETIAAAANQAVIPRFRPNGIGATLIFHTESGSYVLGGIRSNPALEKELTNDGKPFPQQINSTIGGFLKDPESNVKSGIVTAIKNKLFLDEELKAEENGFESQQILKTLVAIIENDQGWENKIAVHTDHWQNQDNSRGIMCFLTAIKHIHCSDADKDKIDWALKTMIADRKEKGVNPKTLSAFEFVPLQPIIENSHASYFNDELTKAKKAYQTFGNKVAVTFNDLAVATLAMSKAFHAKESAEFVLPEVQRQQHKAM